MYGKRFRLPGRIAAAFFIFLTATPTLLRADALDIVVRTLARRALSVMQGNHGTCLAWENRGALPDTRSLQLRTAFLGEMPGLQPAATQDQTCAVRVLIGQTPASLVFSARVSTPDGPRILVGQALREEIARLATASSALRLQKELVWQQSDPILAALFIPDAQNQRSALIVLARETVFLLHREATQWMLTKTWPLGASPTDRRAPRGELSRPPDRPGSVHLHLPGKKCELNLESDAPPVCQDATEDWRTQSAFSSSCDAASWRLRTGSSDWSSPDRIALVDGSLPVSEAPSAEIVTPGPVLSLAEAASPESGAAAVVYNLTTGNYEVYAITLDCSN